MQPHAPQAVSVGLRHYPPSFPNTTCCGVQSLDTIISYSRTEKKSTRKLRKLHFWFTKAMTSRISGYIAASIAWDGDKKKSSQALYMNISDQQLLDAVDTMRFDKGETDIRVRKK